MGVEWLYVSLLVIHPVITGSVLRFYPPPFNLLKPLLHKA